MLLINFKHSCRILSLISSSVFLVCPQQGATTITQIKLVPRPKGIAKLRCDFNVPPDPIHPDTGFLYIAWVIDTSNQLYTHLYDPKYVSKAVYISSSAVLVLIASQSQAIGLGVKHRVLEEFTSGDISLPNIAIRKSKDYVNGI